MNLADIDQKLVNLLQVNFPLTREPYTDLGLQLGISSNEIISRINSLKKRGIVHQIAPVFDAKSLGYNTTLVAMKLSTKEQLDEATEIISTHAGVSHCYERDHDFNFWFTLAMAVQNNMETELQRLATIIKPMAILNLPAVKTFKIVAYFNSDGDNQAAPNTDINDANLYTKIPQLSSVDRDIINELQQDLPLTQKPFDLMSQRLSLDTDEFLRHCQSLIQRRIMRRFSAAVSHNKLGFIANSMTCWKVSPEKVETAGKKIATFPEVSHCYERKTNQLWTHNLFAMIHANNKNACHAVADRISSEVGLNDTGPLLLFSTKEFKKVRTKYSV